jgi:hypothetical protein
MAKVGALLACLALSAALGLFRLGERPLQSQESRCAVVGYEMFESGDWVQPRLDHVRFYEKPPLLYWSLASSYRWLGVDEFSSRLPGVLAHLGTTALVFVLAFELLGAEAATCAGLIYATAVGPFIFSRTVFVDSPLVFFLTLSLVGLTLSSRRNGSWVYPTLFHLGVAGAGLSKGLLGLFLPYAAAATCSLGSGGLDLVRRLRPVLGLLVLLGIFAPWHLLLAWRDPSFLYFYVVNEHVYRFLDLREPRDLVPLSVAGFWTASTFWFLPWSLFLPSAAWWSRRRLATLTVPLVFSAVVMGFFTLAQSRAEKYGLPALPALAILVGGYWQDCFVHPRASRAPTISALILTVVAFGMIAAAFFLPSQPALLTALVSTLDGNYREHPEAALALGAGTARLLKPFSFLLLALGVTTLVAARARKTRLAFLLWVALFAPALLFVDRGVGLMSEDRAQRALAEQVVQHWESGSRLVVDAPFEDVLSLVFYVHRPTTVVPGDISDLLFGKRMGDAPDLFLTPAELENEWRSPKRLFLCTERDRKPPRGAVSVFQTPSHILYTNRPLDRSFASDQDTLRPTNTP